VFVMRRILIENVAPGTALINLVASSLVIFIVGALVFNRLSKRLYDLL